MKNVVLILLTILWLPLSAGADNLDNPVLGYDSIMHIVDREDVPFIEKYKMQYPHLTVEQQIEIKDKLINFAEKDATKEQLITLYCNIYSNYDIIYKPDEGWPYLEKAYKNSDQIEDNDILGFMYYLLGQYYGGRSDDVTSHEFYYKSIPYLEKSEKIYPILNTVYFSLSVTYANKNDYTSLKRIIDKMLTLRLEGYYRGLLVNTYSTAANYFSKMRDLDSTKVVYQDSTIYYYKKARDLFEHLKDSLPYLANSTDKVVSGIYLDLAKELMHEKQPNWDEIMSIVEKGKGNLNSNSGSISMSYYMVKGEGLLRMKKFKEAETIMLSAEAKLNSKEFGERDNFYFNTYTNLSKVYESTGKYELALKYQKLANNYNSKINDLQKHESLKMVETKYETAQKDLLISQQKEREQQLIFNRTLWIGGLVAVAVLLMLAVLYNRLLRLRKEKEIVDLDKGIKDKEIEYLTLLNESDKRQTRTYLNGREAEGTRLAKELHDNVANKLYRLEQELKKIDQLPNDILPQLEDLYSNVRNISHELIPPVFQYASLTEILHNYVFVQNEKVNTTLNLIIGNEEDLKSLPKELSLEIYRIAQESISNILKHAKAKNAWISLSINNNQAMLTIEDDGEGFDTEKTQRGIGLQIMKSRCESLQGKFHISSNMENGTKIETSFPLSQPNVAE